MSTLEQSARAWLAADPDPETRAETERRLAAGDAAWLAEGFTRRLAFGTAGMRGPMGPGPGRMNRLLVRRVTRALAEHVRARGGRRVVVGFDGRRNSRIFAGDVAGILAGAGLQVHAFPDLCPTPVLAYAVTRLGADAGVMVTASHNPPQDNGYKVYGPEGAQIVSPTDAEISALLDALPPDAELPLGEGVLPVAPELVESYLREVAGLRVHPGGGSRPLVVAYTPLHGVGGALVQRVLAEAGHQVHVVPEQALPDGDFPTVSFPNPEEPGALDRVLALARAVGADLVLANDPDADRIAAAIPEGDGWRPLTGNEVGTLLAEDLLAHGEGGGRRMVATSLVSSSLLRRIADHHGAEYAETLTGFKWIARAGLASQARFVLGFEEALGVCAGEVVRDKDGVSAALLVADLAAHLLDRGGLGAAVDALHLRHGVHLATQLSWTLPGLDGQARIAATMAAFRADPPVELAGRAVRCAFDTAVGVRRILATGALERLDLPRSDVLGFELEGGDRVLLRPSGTEPKLKAYVEVVEPVRGGELEAARAGAADRLRRLREVLGARIAG